MTQAGIVEGLAGSLLEIAAQPVRIGGLYEVLGEYCHQVRNRLNSLKLSLYLARRNVPCGSSEIWKELDRQYRGVESLIAQLQDICRPMHLAPIRAELGAVLDDRQSTWAGWFSTRKRPLILIHPESPSIGYFDPQRFTQGLDALADWRAIAGDPGTPVLVEWRAEGDHLVLEWKEPGSSIHGVDTRPSDRPASLALPLIARIVAAHGGSFSVGLEECLHLKLRWPIDALPA